MFKSNLRILQIPDGRWQLLSPLVYNDITVPAGFITDLTTGFIEGKHTRASVLHDYALSLYTRLKADKIMREALPTLNVNPIIRIMLNVGAAIGTLCYYSKKFLTFWK